jgi:hypothetical protein
MLTTSKPVLTNERVCFQMASIDSTTKTIQIQLHKGSIAIIDEQDADLLQYKWDELASCNKTYAKSAKYFGAKQVLMHRVILGRMLGHELVHKEIVDHIDGNGLNCTRGNLRLATGGQNAANSGLYKSNTSGYRGVSFRKDINKWQAKIRVDQKLIHLGHFDTAELAYEAYKAKAISLWGEFTKL